MRRRGGGAAALSATLLLAAGLAIGATPVSDEAVTEVARQLRCVVCQNLSVADSPSEMARQMRDLIRERLAQGQTPSQVIAYFEERYGEWVLLSPKLRGFSLVVWILPFAALIVGLGIVLVLVRRWTRQGPGTPEPAAAAVPPAERERIRLEVERLRDRP